MNLNISASSSSTGSSSGIDVTSVVNQILDADRAPEKLWQAQQDTLTRQTNTWSVIQSNLSDLSSKLGVLTDVVGGLNTKSASSSQPSLVTASAQSNASTGNHIIVVSNLANTSAAYTDPITDSSLTTGTITVKVGTGAAQTVPIDSSDNTTTIAGLATYINNHSELGVSASVVSDASGSRLALLSNTSGQPGDLTVSSDISALNFHTTAGRNSSLTIDGVPVSTAGNTVTGVIPGVTLNLLDASPSTEIQLRVGSDTANAEQAVTDFVNSYNTAIQTVNAQFVYDSTTATSGSLASDSTLRLLQASLLSQAGYSTANSSGLVGLASLGITMNNDGTLSVDTSQLSDILSNQYSSFVQFMQGSTATTQGFANQFSTELNRYTDTASGMIPSDLNQISSTQQLLTDQINNLEDRLAVRQQQLIAQYSQVDTALRQYSLLMNQIASELGSLPGAASSSS
jgi:flagellar hook-associated protein 2